MKLSPAQLNAYTTAECCSTAECYTAPPAVPLIGQKDTKPIPQQAAHRRNGRDWPVRYDEALPEVDKAANVGVITVVKPNWYEKVSINANTTLRDSLQNSSSRKPVLKRVKMAQPLNSVWRLSAHQEAMVEACKDGRLPELQRLFNEHDVKPGDGHIGSYQAT